MERKDLLCSRHWHCSQWLTQSDKKLPFQQGLSSGWHHPFSLKQLSVKENTWSNAAWDAPKYRLISDGCSLVEFRTTKKGLTITICFVEIFHLEIVLGKQLALYVYTFNIKCHCITHYLPRDRLWKLGCPCPVPCNIVDTQFARRSI